MFCCAGCFFLRAEGFFCNLDVLYGKDNQRGYRKYPQMTCTRVSDPCSFDTDPDPDHHSRLNTDPDPIRIQGFYDQKLKKIYSWKKKKIFWDKKLQFTYPLASIKGAQVTKEAFSSQKRTSSTAKHEISYFLLLWVIFALLDPDPLRIRIRNPGLCPLFGLSWW